MIANLETAPAPLTLLQSRLFWGTALLLALTRWWALAATPWDWDEFLFMSALRDFDVTMHHPHPPGFPLYIAAAKFLRLVIQDDFRALQGVGFAASILLFPALFLLARELRFAFPVALGGALLCTLMPNVVIFGGSAFSDVTSLTLVVAACAFLLRGVRDRRFYFLGALVLAIAIGVRPQNLVVGFAPGLLATVARMRCRWYDPLVAFLLGLLIVGGAYGGAAAASASVSGYRRTVAEHKDYIARTDAIGAPTRNEKRIALRVTTAPYCAGSLNYLFTILVGAGIAAAMLRREGSMLLLSLSFVPMIAVVWLLLDQNSLGRFSVAIVPFFSFAAAYGLHQLTTLFGRRSSALYAASTLLIALALLVWVVPAVAAVHQPSPPYAAARHVLSNVPRTSPLYVTTGLRPLADYYFEGYRPIVIENEFTGRVKESGTVVSDIEIAGKRGRAEFARPRRRISHVVRNAYFFAKVAPVSPVVRFGDGWYNWERSGYDTWRWMAQAARVELPPIAGDVTLILDIGFPTECTSHQPRLKVIVNGALIDDFVPPVEIRKTYTIHPRPGSPNEVRFAISKTCNPLTAGTGTDSRDLGMQLREISWTDGASR